jgi:hypothetical protein
MRQYHVIIANWYTVRDCPNTKHSRRSRGGSVVPPDDYTYNGYDDDDDDDESHLAATATTQLLIGGRRVRYANGFGDCWTPSCLSVGHKLSHHGVISVDFWGRAELIIIIILLNNIQNYLLSIHTLYKFFLGLDACTKRLPADSTYLL